MITTKQLYRATVWRGLFFSFREVSSFKIETSRKHEVKRKKIEKKKNEMNQNNQHQTHSFFKLRNIKLENKVIFSTK